MQLDDLYPELAAFVRTARAEAHLIPPERRGDVERLARFIRERLASGESARLVFICTHNSRRSLLAQVWAETAAHVHGVSRVEAFSGGTEATAFDGTARETEQYDARCRQIAREMLFALSAVAANR